MKLNKRTQDGLPIGFQAVRHAVSWGPKMSLERPKGMSILLSAPSALFEADTFVQGSRKRLEKVVESISFHFTFNAGRDFNPTLEWQSFAADDAPQTDNVNDYTSANGLKLPLGEVLLGLENGALSSAVSSSDRSVKPMACSYAGNSVSWSSFDCSILY